MNYRFAGFEEGVLLCGRNEKVKKDESFECHLNKFCDEGENLRKFDFPKLFHIISSIMCFSRIKHLQAHLFPNYCITLLNVSKADS